MIKKSIVFVLVLMCLASGVIAEEKINLRSIRYSEVVEAGTEVPFYVSVRNVHGNELDDVYVTIDSPELDIYRSSGDIDIRSGDAASFTVPVELPWYVKPGEYLIRVKVSYDDEYDRHYYRYIVVR